MGHQGQRWPAALAAAEGRRRGRATRCARGGGDGRGGGGWLLGGGYPGGGGIHGVKLDEVVVGEG